MSHKTYTDDRVSSQTYCSISYHHAPRKLDVACISTTVASGTVRASAPPRCWWLRCLSLGSEEIQFGHNYNFRITFYYFTLSSTENLLFLVLVRNRQALAALNGLGAGLLANGDGRVVQRRDGEEPGAGEGVHDGDDGGLALLVVRRHGQLDVDGLRGGRDVCFDVLVCAAWNCRLGGKSHRCCSEGTCRAGRCRRPRSRRRGRWRCRRRWRCRGSWWRCCRSGWR